MSRMTTSGTVCKSFAPDEADMALINAQALVPLEGGDVYAFRVDMCDTAVDRAFEHFSDEALGQMAKLFVGRTVIKNHDRKCDNQVARLFRCEVEDRGDRRALVGYAYTLDNEANATFVAGLRAGIYREVSVSFACKSATCSICGTNNVERYCKHYPGGDYDGKTCTYELSDVSDAYELSFVAVPCQPRAGTVKSYGDEPWVPGEEEQAPRADGARELSLRARLTGAWAAGEAAGHEGE